MSNDFDPQIISRSRSQVKSSSEILDITLESTKQDKNRKASLLMILMPFMLTLVMIGLMQISTNSGSVEIIASFIAGMFGYATLFLLRREFS